MAPLRLLTFRCPGLIRNLFSNRSDLRVFLGPKFQIGHSILMQMGFLFRRLRCCRRSCRCYLHKGLRLLKRKWAEWFSKSSSLSLFLNHSLTLSYFGCLYLSISSYSHFFALYSTIVDSLLVCLPLLIKLHLIFLAVHIITSLSPSHYLYLSLAICLSLSVSFPRFLSLCRSIFLSLSLSVSHMLVYHLLSFSNSKQIEIYFRDEMIWGGGTI